MIESIRNINNNTKESEENWIQSNLPYISHTLPDSVLIPKKYETWKYKQQTESGIRMIIMLTISERISMAGMAGMALPSIA